jgi:UDP-arabinose 4-epimerase
LKVLVTGGAGYIGSQTCKHLNALGHEVLVYDNLSTGFKENLKWGNFIEGDIRDEKLLSKTLINFKPTGVIHFAASAYVAESVENPEKYFSNNVAGSLILLSTMVDAGIENLVFSSTCATYGIPSSTPIDELANQNPINPYGKSKLMVEQALRDISEKGKLKFAALRYFNAAGADSESELIEKHTPETHLIPLALRATYGNYQLKIFGNDFDTFDGTAVRDYVHVMDLAYAHSSALDFLVNKIGKNEFINLGTGKGISVLEIVKTLQNLGLNPNFEIVERRIGDPAILVANAEKATKLLSWTPKHSSIEEIISSVIQASGRLKLN